MRPSSQLLIVSLLLISLFPQLHVGLYDYAIEPNAFAQTVPLPVVATIDRGRSGSRSGLMTRAYVRTVVIDRTSYPLALEILIEDRKGSHLTVEALQRMRWNSGVEIEVRYWGPAHEITQMIVTLPE